MERCDATLHLGSDQPSFQLYKVRWFMLFLLVMCYVSIAFQFLQFSIIANIIVEFYGVSYEEVDWTTMVQFVFYIVLIFPAMHIMNKIEIRTSLLIALLGICASSWIKIASAVPDRFWVIMLAQAFISIAQPFISVLPPYFASAWFGVKETALACGIGVFGYQLGILLSCYVPTILIQYSKDKDAVAHDMNVLNISLAVVCTVFLILTFAFFKSEPPSPPSGTQEQLETTGKKQFKDSTMLLFKNLSYVTFLLAYAIGTGVFYVISTLLNQIIQQYYPNASEEVGKIGLIINVMGLLASTITGYVLGKLQLYRLTTILVFALYLLGMIMFTVALPYSLIAVYVASVILGFSMTAAYSIGLEVAAELTYPVPECMSSGYLIASGQFAGIIFIYLYSFILYNYGAFWSNVAACVKLLISAIMVASMKFIRKRQAAEELYGKRIEQTIL